MPPEKIIGDVSPAFSPDGKWLAFLRTVSSGVNDIWVMPITGGPARRVTFENRQVLSLTWNPDGRSIVYSTDRRGNMWRVPVSGGTSVRLAMVAENATDPAFSRDGRKLVYTQFFSDANIWRMDAAGASAPGNAEKMELGAIAPTHKLTGRPCALNPRIP